MVQKIRVKPGKVRGLGNILSPKTVNEYSISGCDLTESTEMVNGANVPVFSASYTETPFDIYNVGVFNINQNGELIVTLNEGISNPFRINQNGELVVSLEGENNYVLQNNQLIYQKED